MIKTIQSIALVFSLLIPTITSPTSSAWLTIPGSNNFYDGSNWTAGVPGSNADVGNTDIATFGASSIKNIDITTDDVYLGGFAISDTYTFNLANILKFISPASNTGTTVYNVNAGGQLYFSGSSNANANTQIVLSGGNSSSGGSFSSDTDISGGIVIDSIEGSGFAVFLRTPLTFGGNNTSTILDTPFSAVGVATTVFKKGTGTFTLTKAGNSNYTFQIDAGAFQIGNNTTAGTVNGKIINNSLVIFNRSNAHAHTAIIQGPGIVRKIAANTLTLSGTNTYSGGTELIAGTLALGNDAALGTGTVSVLDNAAIQSTAAGRSITNAFTITSGKVLTISGSNNLVLGGGINGLGGINHTNSATTILSVTNTYSGGTTITAGTLQGDSNSLQGDITNNANLTFNQTSSGTYSGIISGAGTLNKNGTGKLILNGINSYLGLTTINAGELQIGDQSHLTAKISGNISVNSGATISGHGQVTGNLTTIGGTVAPGGSVGTLIVAGNYSADSSSNLQIEVSPSAASLLQVTGNATLSGGTVRLIFDAGSYSEGSYNILTATTVTGTFTNVNTTNLPLGFTTTIRYLSNAIQLLLNRSTSTTPNLNQRATTTLGQLVGTFLDNVAAGSPTAQQQQLINSLNNISNSEQLNIDLEQVAPVIAQPLVTINLNIMQQQQITTRLAHLQNNHYSAGENGLETGFWIQPFYYSGKQKNLGTLLGYLFNTSGVMLGVDREINSNSLLGIAGSYAYANQKSLINAGTRTSINNYLGILYGTNLLRYNFQLDWVLAGGKNHYNGIRIINVNPVSVSPTAEYNGQQYSAQAIFSKRFAMKALNLAPEFIANYIYLHQQAYSEQGAGSLGMNVALNNSSVFTAGGGIKIDCNHKWHKKTLVPEAHALCFYDLKSANQNATSTFITGGPTLATSATPGRITGQFGSSATINFNNQLILKIEYDLQIKNQYYSNIWFLNFRYIF